jgi:hypothetical protein
MKWREHDDPGIEADLAELGEWGPELRALREEPTPAFLQELDRRLQPDFSRGRSEEQIAATEKPKRGFRLWPALAIGAPAAAALVVVVVLIAGSGGDEGPENLPVAVQSSPSAQATGGAAAPSGAEDNALSRPGGPSAPSIHLVSKRVSAGEPLMLRYSAPHDGTVFVSLAPTGGGTKTLTRRVALPAGSGDLKIATDQLTAGTYGLVVTLPNGQSALRASVELLD